jgi:hypothetical protein
MLSTGGHLKNHGRAWSLVVGVALLGLFLAAYVPHAAAAASSLVQQSDATNLTCNPPSCDVSAPFGSAVTSGNVVLVVIADYATTAPTVTDNLSSAYTLLSSAGGSGGVRCLDIRCDARRQRLRYRGGEHLYWDVPERIHGRL